MTKAEIYEHAIHRLDLAKRYSFYDTRDIEEEFVELMRGGGTSERYARHEFQKLISKR